MISKLIVLLCNYIVHCLSFKIFSLFLIDQIWIVWNQLRSGGKGQKTGSKRKKRWPGGGRGKDMGGGGRDVAEPRDMPLMLPFCDTILVSNVFMLTDSQ